MLRPNVLFSTIVAILALSRESKCHHEGPFAETQGKLAICSTPRIMGRCWQFGSSLLPSRSVTR